MLLNNAVSHDAELAFVSGDLERCQARIAAALALLEPDNDLFAILSFYQWLANPEQGWEYALNVVSTLKPEMKFTWDFSTTTLALDRLDSITQRNTRQFINFFEGSITLPMLKVLLVKQRQK